MDLLPVSRLLWKQRKRAALFLFKSKFSWCIRNSVRFSTSDLQNEEYIKLREKYLQEEERWEKEVDLSRLTATEKEIYVLHKEACKDFKFTYIDPITGYKVFTRYRHFLRNKCCGSGCRHCPFEHTAVHPDFRNETRFNSAFYVPNKDDNNDNNSDVEFQ